jgi:fibronectin-binding autotransporter adhesin
MLVYTRTAARGGGSAVSVAASGSIGLGVGGSGFFNATAVDQLFANTLSGITMNATSGVGIDTSAGNFTYATSQSATRSLTKLGANTLTLSGNNTYSGQTFVNAGTLAVTGSIVGSGVTVRNGGTLAGNGTISGSVTVNGGTISPGNSPGTLTIDGALSLESLSLLDFELNAGDQTVGGGINDLITLGSDLILDGTLDVTSSPLSTGTWRLFNYSGNLTDLGLTVGSISLAPSHSASIETSVLGQINLVVVPEPATIALLGSGVAMLGLRLVRRRQASARDRV